MRLATAGQAHLLREAYSNMGVTYSVKYVKRLHGKDDEEEEDDGEMKCAVEALRKQMRGQRMLHLTQLEPLPPQLDL